jgi:uncharacterized protein (TIGR02145 family)
MKKIIYFTSIAIFTLISCSKDKNDEAPVPIVTTTPTPTPTIVSNAGNGVVDVDGNIYSSIVLGNGQEWMGENLKTTKYSNGDNIPEISDGGQWSGLTIGAYCWYNNDSSSYEIPYGKLYNWHTVVDSRNVCPTGWRVPSDNDWKVLEYYLGMDSVELDSINIITRGTNEGGKLKEVGTAHWLSPNTGATNEINFNAVPAGYRDVNSSFNVVTGATWFWSSTSFNSQNAISRAIPYSDAEITRWADDKGEGYSIRCIKN